MEILTDEETRKKLFRELIKFSKTKKNKLGDTFTLYSEKGPYNEIENQYKITLGKFDDLLNKLNISKKYIMNVTKKIFNVEDKATFAITLRLSPKEEGELPNEKLMKSYIEHMPKSVKNALYLNASNKFKKYLETII